MYLIGVWLGAYYDWWVRRTARHPILWEAGTFLMQFPLLFLLWIVPPIWILVLYPVMALLLVPAYLAASRNRSAVQEKATKAWRRTKQVQNLIKRSGKN